MSLFCIAPEQRDVTEGAELYLSCPAGTGSVEWAKNVDSKIIPVEPEPKLWICGLICVFNNKQNFGKWSHLTEIVSDFQE